MRNPIFTLCCFFLIPCFPCDVSATSLGPPLPTSTENCFILASSSFQAENISQSYADYVFSSLQSILYHYLGKGIMDADYFYNHSEIPDFRGTKIDLSSKLRGESDSVILQVTIKDSVTGEEYFSESFSECYFTPNKVLESFSSSFARDSKLVIPNSYAYSLAKVGFSMMASGILLDGVYYNLLLPEGMDLLLDIQRVGGVPKTIMDEIGSFSARTTIEFSSFLIGNVIGIVSLLVFAGSDSGDFAISRDAKTGFAIATAAGFLVGWSSLVAFFLDRPTKLTILLKDWSSSRCR